MKDQVASALAALVLEKGVKAEVMSIASNKQVGGTAFGVDFSISDPMVKVGEVRIDQVSTTVATKISEVKKRFIGQEYDVDSTGPALSDSLRDAYLDLGYLDIATDPLTHATPKVGATAITIDVATTVHEGAVYHVSKMVWPESAIVSEATLAGAAQLKPGDPASRIELLSTVARAGGRFASVGYLDAKISVDPQKDDAHHEVAYKFSVTPGEQYRFASVKTVN